MNNQCLISPLKYEQAQALKSRLEIEGDALWDGVPTILAEGDIPDLPPPTNAVDTKAQSHFFITDEQATQFLNRVKNPSLRYYEVRFNFCSEPKRMNVIQELEMDSFSAELLTTLMQKGDMPYDSIDDYIQRGGISESELTALLSLSQLTQKTTQSDDPNNKAYFFDTVSLLWNQGIITEASATIQNMVNKYANVKINCQHQMYPRVTIRRDQGIAINDISQQLLMLATLNHYTTLLEAQFSSAQQARLPRALKELPSLHDDIIKARIVSFYNADLTEAQKEEIQAQNTPPSDTQALYDQQRNQLTSNFVIDPNNFPGSILIDNATGVQAVLHELVHAWQDREFLMLEGVLKIEAEAYFVEMFFESMIERELKTRLWPAMGSPMPFQKSYQEFNEVAQHTLGMDLDQLFPQTSYDYRQVAMQEAERIIAQVNKPDSAPITLDLNKIIRAKINSKIAVNILASAFNKNIVEFRNSLAKGFIMELPQSSFFTYQNEKLSWEMSEQNIELKQAEWAERIAHNIDLLIQLRNRAYAKKDEKLIDQLISAAENPNWQMFLHECVYWLVYQKMKNPNFDVTTYMVDKLLPVANFRGLVIWAKKEDMGL